MNTTKKTIIKDGTQTTKSERTNYRLIYFDLRGRGEIPRLLFHAANVPFCDDRIDSEEEWFKTFKASKLNRSLNAYYNIYNIRLLCDQMHV